MKPISKNKLIEDFASENNLDPKLVNIMVTQYFKEIRNMMNSLNYKRITIPFLGKLWILHYKLDNKIAQLKSFLDYIPPTSFQNVAKYKELEERIKKYEKLKEMYAKEKEEIRLHKEQRKANRSKLS